MVREREILASKIIKYISDPLFSMALKMAVRSHN
jgi:hypothetical protein